MRIPSLLSALALLASAHAQTPTDFEAAMKEHFTADAPGGAAIVTKGSKVLYEGALGMADMAKGEALTVANQFRIGSVSKQFAAVAIMQLAEQGKLQLDDEIQKYVDFPRKEQPITITHLLTHSSGIPSFTSLPIYQPEAYAKDIELPEIIALFADLPLEFEPGTQFSYSNSGYLLLTAIIERASGLSWTAYADAHLFKSAGMAQSSAAITGPALPAEAIGYTETESGWEPAPPISLTWPRAAGCIRSTVRDLWKWNTSVFAGKQVSTAMLAKAHVGQRFPDGSTEEYGYGWGFQNVQGSRTIEHSGGIDGFVSNSLYLPEEDIYVAVLVNRESSDASYLAPKLAAIALGKPYGGTVLPLSAEAAAEYTGVYVSADSVERYITADAGGLHSQRQGSRKMDLHYLGDDRFLFAGDVTTLTFHRTNGRVSGARFLTRGRDELLVRSSKPLPAAHVAIPLDNATLQAYVGKYELMPDFILSFRAEGDRFFLQPPRQAEVEVFGEAPHKFFLKVVDATIEFHPEADGSLQRLTFTQGDTAEGRRIE